MADARSTLELIFDTAQLKTASGDIKAVGTETTKATSAVTKMGTESKSVASKIGEVGKKFSTSVVSAGALAGSVLNLSRQYQDLGDSQIRVDKTQLKVSKTAEAVNAAHTKLNATIKQFGQGSAQAVQAQLDLNQAEEAATLAVTMHGEALEDQQRAQENFWVGLVPTVVTAGGTIMSVITDLKGVKGIGGLGTAAAGSVGGLNAMTTATTGLGTAMKGVALSMLPVALALGGVALTTKAAGLVIHEIISIMKGDMLEAVNSMSSLIDLIEKIGPALGPFGGIQTSIFTAMKPEITKFKDELKKVPPAIKPIPPELQQLDNIGQGMSGTIDNLIGGVMGLVQHANAVPGPAKAAAGSIASMGTVMAPLAKEAQFLDANLQPMGSLFDQLSNSLGTANANLVASASGLSNYQIGVNAANTSTAAWVQQSAIKIAQDTQELASLRAVAEGMGIHTGAVGSNIEVLKLLIQAQQAAAQGNHALAASFFDAAKAAQASAAATKKAADAAAHTRMFGSGVKVVKGIPYSGPVVTHGGQKYYGGAPPITGYRYKTPSGKIKRHKKAQFGMHEFLTEDTMIHAHKGEEAHIDKPGRGGGGGANITITFLPEQFKQFIRYSITEGQGTQK